MPSRSAALRWCGPVAARSRARRALALPVRALPVRALPARALPARALLGASLLAACASNTAERPRPAASVDSLDVLVVGGRLLDGSGGAERPASVGWRGDRLVWVQDAAVSPPPARRRIDAAGRIVAPGFVDPHAHVLLDLGQPASSRLDGYLAQGVTTVLTGNDGGGPIDVRGSLARWEANGLGANVGTFVGHGTVRARVLGARDVAPSAAELERMRALVREAMAGGAFGLSSGLYYAPGSFATTAEVAALAREAAPFGGVYDTHMRDESSYTIGLLAAVREALQVGREAGVPVHIAHVKALGVDVWGRSDSVIAIVRAARAAGQAVTADQYPYLASGTSLGASLLPRWAEAGGRDSLVRRLRDPALAARLRGDMTENLRRRGGAESLLITEADAPDLVGRTLAQLATARGTDAITTAIAILERSSPGVASFNMQQADVDAFAREPWVVTGSDGSGGHPRKYGAFAKSLRDFAVDRPVLPLPVFIERSSRRAARALGLADRGELREGAFADVIIFHPDSVRDRATWTEPTREATGMAWVFVNGIAVVDDGRPTTARPGRTLSPSR
jgi:N-acyl-D-amino-acid deacylase